MFLKKIRYLKLDQLIFSKNQRLTYFSSQFNTKEDNLKLENYYNKHLKNVKKIENYLKTNEKFNDKVSYFVNNLNEICRDMKDLEDFYNEDEKKKELETLLLKDLTKLKNDFDLSKKNLIDFIANDEFSTDEAAMEFENGVGGNEAMMFTKQMTEFYTQFCKHLNWTVNMAEFELSNDVNGFISCVLNISGQNCYKILKNEAGVHRVQRVPSTDKMNRVHTSTIAIKVLPIFPDNEIQILSKNIKIETMRATGPGGQLVNKRESCIRITHLPTNISVKCSVHRTQEENKKLAFISLRKKLSEQRFNTIENKKNNLRINQVKGLERSEKIRTFNFQQDRLTDHRIKKDIFNLKSFFDGNSNDELLEWLNQMNEVKDKKLKQEIQNDLNFD